MVSKSEIKSINEFTSELVKNQFIIYCGAGISIPAPSCAPSWWTLTEEILQAFFDRIPDDWSLPKDIIIHDPEKQPELIFENFANMLDLRLYQIFDMLNLSQPNGNHGIIAKLAKKGVLKACITTNFDVFIERSLQEEGVEFDLLVDNNEYEQYFQNIGSHSKKFVLCKIHGTIERPDTIVSVASVYKSSKGFSLPKSQLITHFLKQYPVLFLGYSGWDFEHLNYRRFWDRVGPQVKGIYWNRRPGETGGPNLQEIFSKSVERFHFCEAELPNDFLIALSKYPNYEINSNTITVLNSEKSSTLFKEVKNNRLKFLNKWAQEIPDPFALGLVLSEGNQFSNRFKESMKKLKETAEDKDITNYSMTNLLTELAQKYQNGEIGAEEYQEKSQKYSLQLRLSMMRNKYKGTVVEWIRTNRFPGITDDQIKRDHWLGYLIPLSDNFELEDAHNHAVELLETHYRLISRTDKESRADQMINSYKATLLHPEKALWEPFYNKMVEEKKRYIADLIDYDTFSKICGEIITKYNNVKLGMAIPLGDLFSKLISTVADSPTDVAFQEGCEAIFLTLGMIAGHIYSDLIKKPEVLETYTKITQSIQEKNHVDVQLIDAFDQHIRKLFAKVLDRVKAQGAHSTSYILLEASILKLWSNITPYIDSNKTKNFTKAWDTGSYPLRFTNKSIYDFLKGKLDIAYDKLPSRFQNKILGILIVLAEGGEDFEAVERITRKSLEITENLVTEATPMDIPACLAAFYERQGDNLKALHYYRLALDGIKSAIPPIWQDVIIYRTALLTSESGDDNAIRRALEIIGQFHPDFYGKVGYIRMPAIQHCAKLAEDLAQKLGYENAHVAIKDLIG
ncbi:MAG: SIR2 family protein [Candidatus Hermodarchaeota archaeon]